MDSYREIVSKGFWTASCIGAWLIFSLRAVDFQYWHVLHWFESLLLFTDSMSLFLRNWKAKLEKLTTGKRKLIAPLCSFSQFYWVRLGQKNQTVNYYFYLDEHKFLTNDGTETKVMLI